MPAFLDETTKNIDPAVSMALTRSGAPRVWAIARDGSGQAKVVHLACDANRADPGQNGRKAAGQGPSGRVSSGLDLALDAVYNLDGNIFLASCDADCASPNARGQDTKVELTSEMKADRMIPYPNCTVAA